MSENKGFPFNGEKPSLPTRVSWTPEKMRSQEGIFLLKDVARILDIDPGKVKKKAREIQEKGLNPFRLMGVRKVWRQWVVWMNVFYPYYHRHLKP